MHGEFTSQRKGEPRDLLNAAWRTELMARYEGTSWNTISVDAAGEETPDIARGYVRAIDHSPLKLPGPPFVPCLPLAHQLAQKIHGMTQLKIHEHWRDEFGRLVAEYGLPVGSLEDGVRRARALIARHDASSM